MKKILFTMLVIPAFLAGCSTKCVEDRGIRVARGSVVKPFDKINVKGALKLVLRQDSTYALKVEADSNIVDRIKTQVSGSELRIDLKDGEYCGSDSIVIYSGIGELKSISAAGAVNIVSAGLVNTGDLQMRLSGSTDVKLSLNSAKVITGIDGVGKLTLTGQAGVHELSTNGTADIDAFGFIAGKYDIHITGSGKANINVLNELKVQTEGASNIYYKGNPKKVDERKAGATKLIKVN